jgi:hypothetical protein
VNNRKKHYKIDAVVSEDFEAMRRLSKVLKASRQNIKEDAFARQASLKIDKIAKEVENFGNPDIQENIKITKSSETK